MSHEKTNVALITGITGQDGSYLAELLLMKGYLVHSLVRRSSNPMHLSRIESILPALKLHYGDMEDPHSIDNVLREIETVFHQRAFLGRLEVYNLAAQSDVAVSFKSPFSTVQTDFVGFLNLLEAIRRSPLKKRTFIYQASSSEQFGKVLETPQCETTPFNPQSPYAVSKVAAHLLAANYRNSYGMFICCGILFNHESYRRGSNFVTQKIAQAIRKAAFPIELGNLDAKRDWGHAKDYVTAMWLMLQQSTPRDFVIATGEQYSVREFVTRCFAQKDVSIEWKGTGLQEVGVDSKTNQVMVKVDPTLLRPAEVDTLLGDSSQAQQLLGWKKSISFDQLIHEMLEGQQKL